MRPTFARALAVVIALAVLILAPPSAPAALHTSPAGVRLVTSFEGYVPTVQPDPVGVPTQCYGATGAELLLLPAIATRAQCVAQLRRSLANVYEPPVRRLFLPPRGRLRGLFNQHRFDALVSASYNLGVGLVGCAYRSMCAAINSRQPSSIARALLLYDVAGGRVLPGLTRRRHAEAALWMRPMGRFELWPADEVTLVRGLERLHGHPSAAAAAARTVLRARIAGGVVRLEHVIRATGDPLSHRRSDRLAALERRLPRAR